MSSVVYLVWDTLYDEEVLVGVYIDRQTAEYAVGSNLFYRIERKGVRAQDKRLKREE